MNFKNLCLISCDWTLKFRNLRLVVQLCGRDAESPTKALFSPCSHHAPSHYIVLTLLPPCALALHCSHSAPTTRPRTTLFSPCPHHAPSHYIVLTLLPPRTLALHCSHSAPTTRPRTTVLEFSKEGVTLTTPFL